MDVQQVQKINNLALELIKQGLSHSKDNAVEIAEQMLAREDYTLLTKHMGVKPEREYPNIKSETSSIRFDQKTITNILEKNTQFLTRTIQEFKQQITKLENKVEELKSQLQTVNPPVQKLIQECGKEPKKREKSEFHPKSGTYEVSDVSIEKVFYAGKKEKG